MSNPDQEAFNELTARMQSIHANVEVAPEAHVPIHRKALESAYLQTVEYLQARPELAATYAKVGEIALTTSQEEVNEQELSVMLLKKYVEDGLLNAEEIEEAVEALAETKDALALAGGEEFKVYQELFADVKAVDAPQPAATESAAPALGTDTTVASTPPRARRRTSPEASKVTPPSPETDSVRSIQWRKPSLVDTIKAGIRDTDGTILVGADDQQKEILRFAIEAIDEPVGFNMERLRKDVPSVNALDDADYVKFREFFPTLREQIVEELLTKNIYVRWQDNGVAARGKRYWLEIGFKEGAAAPAVPDAAAATATDVSASQPTQEPRRRAPAAPTPPAPAPEASPRPDSEVLFTRAADFTLKLAQGIDTVIAEGPEYNATKPKYVTAEVARLMDTSLVTAESLLGNLITAGHIRKTHTDGSAHLMVDLDSFQTINNVPEATPDWWAEIGKDNMTITEQDCEVVHHVFATLGKAGEDFTSVWDFRGDLEKVIGSAPTYEDILLFMDKLKTNGFIHMQHTDVGKKRKPLQARFNSWALERWQTDPADLVKELKEDSKKPGEVFVD